METCEIWEQKDGDKVIILDILCEKLAYDIVLNWVTYVRIKNTEEKGATIYLKSGDIEGFIDCLQIMRATKNTFKRKVGMVKKSDADRIIETNHQFNKLLEDEFQVRIKKANELKKQLWRSNPNLQEKMERISSLWQQDWLYLAVDKRYLKIDAMESRLAVSYGVNPTSSCMGFLAPEEQTGNMVLGLHNVMIAGRNRIFLVDSWVSSFPAGEFSCVAQIDKEARIILSRKDDRMYKSHVTLDGNVGAYGVSNIFEIESLKISRGSDEAW